MFKSVGSVVIIQSGIRIIKIGEFSLASASGLWLQYNCCKSLHKSLEEEEFDEVFYGISSWRCLWLPASGSPDFC